MVFYSHRSNTVPCANRNGTDDFDDFGSQTQVGKILEIPLKTSSQRLKRKKTSNGGRADVAPTAAPCTILTRISAGAEGEARHPEIHPGVGGRKRTVPWRYAHSTRVKCESSLGKANHRKSRPQGPPQKVDPNSLFSLGKSPFRQLSPCGTCFFLNITAVA